MAKHIWCWGDIINPDLADRALCAEREREEGRARRNAQSGSERAPDPVPA